MRIAPSNHRVSVPTAARESGHPRRRGAHLGTSARGAALVLVSIIGVSGCGGGGGAASSSGPTDQQAFLAKIGCTDPETLTPHQSAIAAYGCGDRSNANDGTVVFFNSHGAATVYAKQVLEIGTKIPLVLGTDWIVAGHAAAPLIAAAIDAGGEMQS